MDALEHSGTGGNSRAAEETNTALTNVGGSWVVFIQAYGDVFSPWERWQSPFGIWVCELGNIRTAGLEMGLEGVIGPGALSEAGGSSWIPLCTHGCYGVL